MEAVEMEMWADLHRLLESGIEHVLITQEIEDPLGCFADYARKYLAGTPPISIAVNRQGFSIHDTMEKMNPVMRYITKTVSLEKPISVAAFVVFVFERLDSDPRLRRDILMSAM